MWQRPSASSAFRNVPAGAAIRGLRDSLGVREDEELAFSQLECPLP